MKKLIFCVVAVLLGVNFPATSAWAQSNEKNSLEKIAEKVDDQIATAAAKGICPNFGKLSRSAISVRFEKVLQSDGEIDPEWIKKLNLLASKISRDALVEKNRREAKIPGEKVWSLLLSSGPAAIPVFFYEDGLVVCGAPMEYYPEESSSIDFD